MFQLRPQRVVWILRWTLLTLSIATAALRGHSAAALGSAAVLLVTALAANRLPAESRLARFSRGAEVILACWAIFLTGLSDSPFFIYLCVPALAGGLFFGAIDAVILAGLAAAVLLVAAAATGQIAKAEFTTTIGQYVIISVAIGLVAAWARRLLRLQPAVDQPLFDTAYRLLTQLRTVARQLPGTLDPVAVSAELLAELDKILPNHRSAVFARTGGGRLVTLAGDIEDAPGWDVRMDGDSPFAEAWTTQGRQWRALAGSTWLCVLPLVVGLRTIGLVGLEGSGSRPGAGVLNDLAGRCADGALRIQTALVFEDIRDIATAEERQRVAREIHDGIAQELVIVGYGVDNALAELPGDALEARTSLAALRVEVTRIISELRLSLYDLRSDIDPHGGLGAAISSYLRTVGTTSGLTVHITLEESPRRLPAATEAELFRITQEAIHNARKHARANNLWVWVEVKPPLARIGVEDDGVGMSSVRRQGSYGQSIMQERADRVGANLAINDRPGGGTRVIIELAAAAHGRTLSPAGGAQPREEHADRTADR